MATKRSAATARSGTRSTKKKAPKRARSRTSRQPSIEIALSRMAWAVIWGVLGIICLLGLLPSDGFLLQAVRHGMGALFGVGAYTLPFALFGLSALLVMQRNGVVRLRGTCILLLPLLLGSLLHSFISPYSYDLSVETLSELIDSGIDGASGGVLSGTWYIVLEWAVSKPGALLVLFVLTIAALLIALHIPPKTLLTMLLPSDDWYDEYGEYDEDDAYDGEDDFIDEPVALPKRSRATTPSPLPSSQPLSQPTSPSLSATQRSNPSARSATTATSKADGSASQSTARRRLNIDIPIDDGAVGMEGKQGDTMPSALDIFTASSARANPTPNATDGPDILTATSRKKRSRPLAPDEYLSGLRALRDPDPLHDLSHSTATTPLADRSGRERMQQREERKRRNEPFMPDASAISMVSDRSKRRTTKAPISNHSSVSVPSDSSEPSDRTADTTAGVSPNPPVESADPAAGEMAVPSSPSSDSESLRDIPIESYQETLVDGEKDETNSESDGVSNGKATGDIPSADQPSIDPLVAGQNAAESLDALSFEAFESFVAAHASEYPSLSVEQVMAQMAAQFAGQTMGKAPSKTTAASAGKTRKTDPVEKGKKGDKIEKGEKDDPADKPLFVESLNHKDNPKDGGGASEMDEQGKLNAAMDESQKTPVPVYDKPPLDLLAQGKHVINSNAEAELRENSACLMDTLQSFGIDAKVIGIVHGPSVTRFELTIPRGIKISRIVSLSDDIALSLGAMSVRIAPIPDKSAVGIEVPNKTVHTVYIRECIGSPAFSHAESPVSFAVGKDITGRPVIGDIAKMPHMLIAGTTGSGKSVCINSLLISLLYKSAPEDVRLIMVDPKMVELGNYNGIPHLLIPVVTDPKKAAGALNWAVSEMERRYQLFADHQARNLAGYNAFVRAHKAEWETTEGIDMDEHKVLPQIVIVIDELADLMMVAAKEVETSICRIAQKARAAGMHLVVATQRPSADVITGIMKANIPSRIAFAVASQVESRIILDTNGAEKLIGKGDMLYAPLGEGKPMRVQGCFISSEEIEAVIAHIKKTSITEYNEEILEHIERQAEEAGDKPNHAAADNEDDEDEMIEEAIDLIMDCQQASTSMLQRRLKLGYARAGRIMDQLQSRGIVGASVGSKPRQILISREEWQEMKLRSQNLP